MSVPPFYCSINISSVICVSVCCICNAEISCMIASVVGLNNSPAGSHTLLYPAYILHIPTFRLPCFPHFRCSLVLFQYCASYIQGAGCLLYPALSVFLLRCFLLRTIPLRMFSFLACFETSVFSTFTFTYGFMYLS